MQSYSDAFKELQREFLEKLPDRFSKMKAEYALLVTAKWRPDIANEIHNQLHSLAGTAGTFGMQSLGAAARALEARVQPFNKAAPDKATLLFIGAELERLESLAFNATQPDGPALAEPLPVFIAAPNKHPLIYLVDDDDEHAVQVSTELQDVGYQVQVINTAVSLRIACQQNARPDAVVMDMVFPEGEDTGIRLLKELKAGPWKDVPVVIASVRDDLSARLQSYRAGATRYLTKPLAHKKLSDVLDSLTGRVPDPPYKVILVDDDPVLLQAQAAVLQQAGITVYALTDPEQTLELLDSVNPDVLVLDVYMPKIRGPELAAVVRERDASLHLPILFLSAETDISQQLQALNLGGDDFLIKPVQPQHLIMAIMARAKRARQNKMVQQRLQQTLYEREREHQSLNLHALVSITDVAGTILYANDMFCQISGYSKDELLGKNHRIIKSNEHSLQFYRELWGTIKNGNVWHGEICNRRKDGSLYWVKSTITPLIGDTGKPYQYVSVRTDITAQKLAAQAERAKSEAHALLMQASELLLTADYKRLNRTIPQVFKLVGDNLGINRAYLFELSGDGSYLTRNCYWGANDDAKDEPHSARILLNDLQWLWSTLTHGKQLLVSAVARLPDAAGEEKKLFAAIGLEAYCCSPLYREGNITGLIMVGVAGAQRDWSQVEVELLTTLGSLINSAMLRAESEATRDHSLAKLNATLESTKDGILAVDHLGKIKFINRQFREMWRLPESLANEISDDKLLEYALTQLIDPEGFLHKVRALYCSHEESQDLIMLNDGRIFERYSRPLFGDNQNLSRVWSFHDITERCQAEANAEAATERLRRGQLYANIGTWEWNIATGALYWTERIGPLFGYPLGDLATSYDNFLAALHPDDRQMVIDAVTACIEHDVPYNIEHRVVWPDGTVRWLLERGAVSRDEKGIALNMTGVVQDVTDRKNAELALEEREQQLLQAQHLAKLGNWQLELATQKLVWSAEVYRIFGLVPESIEPSVELFMQTVHPDDRILVEKSHKKAEKTGLHDVIHRIILPNGSIRYVHELATLHFDDDGHPLRFVGTVQDLTEHYETEQRLRESEQRFAFAVEGAGDGVWDWNIVQGTVERSDQYARMLGYEPGEIPPTAEAWKASIHPSEFDAVIAHVNAYFAGEFDTYDYELRLKTKSGDYKWILCRGTIVEWDKDGKPSRMIGIHSDISKRKELEFELVAAREQAEQANRAKSEFLSSMSHELRTPMNAILGFSQLMQYDNTLAESHKDSVHEILKAGAHLLELINEVLDLAKVESGRIDLSIEPVALDQLLQECQSLMSTIAERHRISLRVACVDDFMVRADRTRLKQVLLNLLSNAIKYNREAGRVEVEFIEIEQTRLRILIKDTGFGIPPDKLDGLFQPFNRLGAEGSEIEGTGIGLTITKRIVEMMGGQIGFDSELNVGSCFWIELPREQHASHTGDDQDGSANNNMNALEAYQELLYKVLYIEDNPVNLKLVSQLLATVPHIKLVTAHVPELGIELALSEKPDLILLDINMPGMDGYQVLRVLQQQQTLQHVPIIAITANAMNRDIERGMQAGFTDYLTKPINFERFLAVIKHHMTQAGITE